MLDPIKYPQYYVDNPDQLSSKLKDQMEIETPDKIFLAFLVVVIVLAFVFGG